MVPIWNQWDNLGPTEVRAISPTVWTGSRTTAASDWFQATVVGRKPEDGAWQAGLLLNFVSDKDYTVATINQDGTLYVGRSQDGKWSTLPVTGEPGKPEDPLRRVMRAERKDGKVRWLVDGSEVGSFELPDGHLGLSAYRCTVDFAAISFEGFPKTATEPAGRRPARRGK